MKPAADQRPPGPVHADVTGLQPDAFCVGDRHPPEGEIVEQIAGQALDIDAAVAPDLLTRHEAGHELATRPGDQIHPPADCEDQGDGEQTRHGHAPEEGQCVQPGPATSFGLDRLGCLRVFGQNA